MEGGIRVRAAALGTALGTALGLAVGTAVGTAGAALALLAAPSALADDEVGADAPAPQAIVEAPPVGAPPAAPAQSVPASPAAVHGLAAAVGPAQITPPDGVPHLPSPDNLPPGTTKMPTDDGGAENGTVGYLRDLWHAVQNKDVTMGDAILLFAQRPMDSKGSLQDMSPHPAPDPAAAVAPVAASPSVTTPPAPAAEAVAEPAAAGAPATP